MRKLTLFWIVGAILLAKLPAFEQVTSRAGAAYLQLLGEADSLRIAAEYPRAVELARQALAITERDYGKEDTSVARALHILGDCARRENRFDDAGPLLDRALAIREQALGLDDPWVARTLNSLGLLAENLGETDEALALHQRALTIRKAAFGTEHPEVAGSLNNLAGLFVRQARFAQADSLYRLAFDINERTVGPDHPSFALTLNNLASLYSRQGRYAEGERLHKRALAIRERKWGPNHPDVAESLVNLAILQDEQGRYSDAELLLQQAIGIYEQVSGSDDPRVAATLCNLAGLYSDQGRYAEAEPLLDRAADIYAHATGDVQWELALTLNNLASVVANQGRLNEAEPIYQRVIALQEQSDTEESPDLASALNNLAILYGNQGRSAEAEPLHHRAIEIWERIYGPDHPEVATGLNELGLTYDDAGRYADAQQQLARALRIRETMLGEHHPDVAATLSAVATNAMLQGHFAEAQRSGGKAWEIRRENFHDGAAVLAEKSALDYSTFLNDESDSYLSFLLNAPNGATANVARIAQVVLAAKGIVSDGLMARRRTVVQESNEAVRALAEQLQQARFTLSALYVQGPADGDAETYRQDLESATTEKARLEVELARKSTRFARERQQADLEIADITSALPTGAAIVEFMRYSHRTSIRDSESRYLAMVIRGDGIATVHTLGPAAAIDTAVMWYRQHFANPRMISDDSYRVISGNLFSLVWRPFAAVLADASVVFIAPDGDLNLVSFAGLRDDANNFLVEKFPVHYLSTTRDLIRLQEPAAPGSGLLAIGDPDYDAGDVPAVVPGPPDAELPSMVVEYIWTRGLRTGCTALQELIVARLPGTKSEIQAVETEWRKARGEESVSVLLGGDATEASFKSMSGGKRVIHLATHGFFLSGVCRQKQPVAGERVIGDNPLLLSGLLLAGANRHAQLTAQQGEDGVVTAEEIAGLNFDGAQLVVLSACETGLGEVRNGEGVYGLRRAFQLAGARTIVSALWSVDDRATAALMQQLISAQGIDLPAAMRQAALSQISNARANGKSDHPFYWAGFIATGDWRSQ